MSTAEVVKVTRRRAAGIRLHFVAGQLDFFQQGKLGSEMEPDLRFLTAKEEKYLDDTLALVGQVEERLRKLGDRLTS